MQSIRQALFICIAVIGLVIGLAAISSAQSATYTYYAWELGAALDGNKSPQATDRQTSLFGKGESGVYLKHSCLLGG